MPKGACKTCMGRKVEYHSPAKHPEQGDAMSPEQMDQMVEDAAKRSTGSYSNARQMMKPAQQTMPRDTGGGGALDYMRSLPATPLRCLGGLAPPFLLYPWLT